MVIEVAEAKAVVMVTQSTAISLNHHIRFFCCQFQSINQHIKSSAIAAQLCDAPPMHRKKEKKWYLTNLGQFRSYLAFSESILQFETNQLHINDKQKNWVHQSGRSPCQSASRSVLISHLYPHRMAWMHCNIMA